MYEDWPFFAATIDLIEMILAKADMRIAGLYDDVLVSEPAGKKLGIELRQKFADCARAICEVRGRCGAGECGSDRQHRGYRGEIGCGGHADASCSECCVLLLLLPPVPPGDWPPPAAGDQPGPAALDRDAQPLH